MIPEENARYLSANVINVERLIQLPLIDHKPTDQELIDNGLDPIDGSLIIQTGRIPIIWIRLAENWRIIPYGIQLEESDAS